MSSPYAEELVYRPGASLNAPQSRYPGFSPGQTILKAGTVIKKGALPLAQDLTFDRDVAVVTRDGVTLYVNIYRPADVEGPLPAIIAWSPYGKFEGYMTFDDYPYRGGVPQRLLSGLDKFEGPDPVWWCERGYAVVNPDTRGAYRSSPSWRSGIARRVRTVTTSSNGLQPRSGVMARWAWPEPPGWRSVSGSLLPSGRRTLPR